ncbi:MAG: hypothetical protein R3E54_01670 [Halioglobus sp.]
MKTHAAEARDTMKAEHRAECETSLHAELHAGLSEYLAVGGELAELATLEIKLAVRSVPTMVMLGLAQLGLLILAWLGFSACLGWLAFALAGQQVFVGLAAFTLLQCLGLYGAYHALNRCVRRLSLPHTRRQVANLVKGDGDLAHGQAHSTPAA